MSKERLDEANTQLGRELLAIQSSLTLYIVIGLNARAIKTGRSFLGFVQEICWDLRRIDQARRKEEAPSVLILRLDRNKDRIRQIAPPLVS